MTKGDYFLTKTSKGIVLPMCLLVIGMNVVLLGCENPNIKKAEETLKETTVKTGEAAKDLGRGISEETSFVIEEIVEAINLALSVEGVENVTSLLEIRK